MTLFEIVATLIVLAAAFSYVNFRFIKLPTTIGLMALALALSLGLNAIGPFAPGLVKGTQELLRGIDFNDALLHGMLAFMLFAGALHINLSDLSEQGWIVAALALLATIGSTFLVGGSVWYVLSHLGYEVDFIYCLLFGALISPTDPISVIGILKSLGAPKPLEIKIAGESLFNDGVGVVLFLAVLDISGGDGSVTAGKIAHLFLQEAVGGIVFGVVIGYIAYRMLKSVDNYQVEILISLGLVAGGYALAERLHLSAPLAIVVAGMLIGNHGRKFAMSEKTREHLDTFWELVDEILNAVLFVLIGLEVLVLTAERNYVLAGLVAIPLVLLARWISVAIPVLLLERKKRSPYVIRILTWGGLRGGISVAMALSLREHLSSQGPHIHELILMMTYIVVVFSILVQGLTIGPLVRRCLKGGAG